MYIKRDSQKLVEEALSDGLVAVIYGARQVGKTTLSKQLLENESGGIYLNCDDPTVIANLTGKSAIELKSIIGDAKLVVIDEAQRVENIGITLKLIHDTYPDIKLVATGSSSFDLANKVNEPLTGRSKEILLYPLSVTELSRNNTEVLPHARVMLDRGGYPHISQLSMEAAHAQLKSIANNYIFRDAFAPQVIYDQKIINDLLALLAHQIGNEVSYGELASHLSISKVTAMRYVDLLEKAFIIIRVNQYRRNQRVEVGRLRKVYFTDLGIRNAIIDNFLPLDTRDDTGALWENFCFMERLKYLQKTNRWVRSYYWRNLEQREIDLIEQEGPDLRAYEMKYKSAKLPKLPVAFTRNYPDYKSYKLVNQETFIQTMLT
ncbi:MAG: ATP-binding protein [Candidatus Saccharimonadales bacterium]